MSAALTEAHGYLAVAHTPGELYLLWIKIPRAAVVTKLHGLRKGFFAVIPSHESVQPNRTKYCPFLRADNLLFIHLAPL